jgi:hypothetical protein
MNIITNEARHCLPKATIFIAVRVNHAGTKWKTHRNNQQYAQCSSCGLNVSSSAKKEESNDESKNE